MEKMLKLKSDYMHRKCGVKRNLCTMNLKNYTENKWIDKTFFLFVLSTVITMFLVTGNNMIYAGQADDVVQVAEKEIGYTEGANNYNKYAIEVGGKNYNPWCAYFVTWCMRKCNISSDVYPSGAQGGCVTIINWYMKRDRWHKTIDKKWSYNGVKDNGSAESDFVPRKGDLVFFETNGDYSDGPDHIGIVYEYSGGKVYYINGNNSQGKVARDWYSLTNKCVYGFCRPNYAGNSVPQGNLESASGGEGTITVEGWAFQDGVESTELHVYIGDEGGPRSTAEVHTSLLAANVKRTDINEQYGCGNWHGFSYTIETERRGKQPIYVYAINQNGEPNPLIGMTECTIAGKTMTSGAGYTIPNGNYQIITDLNRNMALDAPGDTLEIGKKENITICTGLNRPCDIFEVTYLDDGFYKICLRGTNLSLDVYNGNKDAGTNVWLWDYTGADSQRWSISDNKDGTFRIKSKCNGLSLDVYDGSVKEGENVQVWNDNDSNAQKWRFGGVALSEGAGKTIEDGDYYLATELDENVTLDVPGDTYDVESGANAEVCEGRNREYDVFSLQYLNNGFYKIVHKGSNLCLDVYGGYPDIKTNVQYYSDNGTDSQQWSIISLGNGKYQIKSKVNGLVLDVQDGKALNSQNVWVYPENNTVAQIWKFVPVDNGQRVPGTEETDEKARKDQEAATTVIKKIEEIGEVILTEAIEERIQSAKDAYAKLTEDQKNLIPDDIKKRLTEAEKAYMALEEDLRKEEAEKARRNQESANAVIKKIEDIGVATLTKDSKEKIQSAREAYNKLTDEQRVLVPDNVKKKLTDAENTYEKLDKAAKTTNEASIPTNNGTEENESDDAYEEFDWEEDQFAVEGILYETIDSKTVTVVGAADKRLTELKIPASVTYGDITYKVTMIQARAFYKNGKLINVSIGKNVQTIGTSAFAGCDGLEKVAIGKGMKKIGKSAFKGDKNLRSIKISSSTIKQVGQNAFKGIAKKAKVKVPKGMAATYKTLFKNKGNLKAKIR